MCLFCDRLWWFTLNNHPEIKQKEEIEMEPLLIIVSAAVSPLYDHMEKAWAEATHFDKTCQSRGKTVKKSFTYLLSQTVLLVHWSDNFFRVAKPFYTDLILPAQFFFFEFIRW